MVEWNDPGAGDPWVLRIAAWERRLKAGSLTTMSSTVTTAALSASGSSWTGTAQAAFQSAIDENLPDLALLAESLHTTADVLDVYAAEVARIKDRQETLERRRARLEAERDELRAMWRAADNEAQGPYITFEEPAARAEALGNELHGVGRELDDLDEEWAALVVQRERADADCIGALSSRDVRGALYGFLGEEGACVPADEMLQQLSTMSVADIRALAAAHPELLDRMLRASPAAVAAWWAGLGGGDAGRGSAQQKALIENLPAFLGALGGLPAAVRVAGNRVVATTQLNALREQLRDVKERRYGTGSLQPYTLEYLEKTRVLEGEIDYLQRVANGDVQLYAYDRDAGRIIEMFGDPDQADVLMTFMPGTNTTMESFYTSSKAEGITSLTQTLVGKPPAGTAVAGFVVKQGEFPNLENLWSEGPQHNWYASVLGPRYASFTHELDVITDNTPIVSAEHSFGSAVGGKAETAGAHFEARYILAGIGMTGDWEVQSGTKYHAAQGPGDINRYLDGVENGGLGYDVTPGEVPGVSEHDTGYTGGEWAQWVAPWSPLIGVPTLIDTALDQHNLIITGDEVANGPVLRDLRRVLQEAAAP